MPTQSHALTFPFQNPGLLQDGELRVVLTATHIPNGMGIEVPTYCFMMSRKDEEGSIGHVHLRVGNTDNLVLYQGHIGYGVGPRWRGHHYAERATRLILPLAKFHDINPVWITCDPDNLPSRRTCERARGSIRGNRGRTEDGVGLSSWRPAKVPLPSDL